MIYEWRPDSDLHNFGDYLGRLLIPHGQLDFFENNESVLLAPIGSVINNAVIEHAIWLGKTPVFANCGWDGSELNPELVAKAIFVGCRGPLTQKELSKFGVVVQITGDPGYGVRKFISKLPKSNKILLIPHGTDQKSFQMSKPTEISEIVTPFVSDFTDFVELANKISISKFVFTGAMHAAITAHALGVPFGLYKSSSAGFVDHPLKWDDWLGSVNLGDPFFTPNLSEAQNWYEQVVSRTFFSKQQLQKRKFIKRYSRKSLKRVFDSVQDTIQQRID